MGFYKRIEQLQADRRRRQSIEAREKRLERFDVFAAHNHRFVGGGWAGMSLLEEFQHMSLLDEVLGRPNQDGRDAAGDDPSLYAVAPTLHLLMTATPKSSRGRRTVCTLTILFEEGLCKAGLRDRDNNMSLWVSTNAFSEIPGALEKALGQRPVAWRRQKPDQSRIRTST